MTKLFLVALPLAAVLAEVSAEELALPTDGEVLEEARRLVGPEWTWPVKPWKSNHKDCPSEWLKPTTGSMGNNDQRGLTCSYDKVCCPFGGKCVAKKQATCTIMLPYGCSWKMEDYGNTMWKDFRCTIVHAGAQPTPTPTPSPDHHNYRSLGKGKCLTTYGADPPNKYFAGLGDYQCQTKCQQRSDCGGYSVSGYNNCLIWLTTSLKGGGASWDGATCIVKNSNPPPVHVNYRSLGNGKCLTTYGADPPSQYFAGIGNDQCKAKCNNHPKCGGYSVSGYNNCLLWMTSGLVGGGANWDGAKCFVKKGGNPPAKKGWWWCEDGKAEIQRRYICDGVCDCNDCSDELPRNCYQKSD